MSGGVPGAAPAVAWVSGAERGGAGRAGGGGHCWIRCSPSGGYSGLDTKALLLEGKQEGKQSRFQRAVNMTRPINYLIEALGFEDEKCCVSGEFCCF